MENKTRFYKFTFAVGLFALFWFSFLNQWSGGPKPIAAPAALNATSFFDDYDNLTYVNQPTLTGVTWDGASAITVNVSAPSAGGPVALWRMDGNGQDSSGNNYHSTLADNANCGATGRFSQGCALDGTGDALTLPAMSNATVGTMTASAWINRVGLPPTAGRYSILHGALTTSGNDEILKLQLNSSGQLRVENDYGVLITCGPIIPENTWTHVAYTINGTDARAYINGSQCGQANGTSAPSGSLGAQNFIGARSNTTEQNFNGTLDEVAIWNRVLTPSEISQIAQSSISTGSTAPASGSFRSAAITSGAFSQITGTWTDTTPANATVSISTNGGTTWCPLTRGQALTSGNCLPGATNLIYRADFIGVDSFQSINFNWTPVVTQDTTPPSVPAGLAASAVSSSQINLTWTASTDNVAVTGYRIYRNGAQVGTSATATYQDTGLTANTTYSYTVAALDAANNASSQSTAASATTQQATVTPGAITPSLVPTRTSCVAPCAIWFDASGTTQVGATVNDVRLGLDYNYNYGDPNSGNWTRGALARNGSPSPKNSDRDTGVVGFHVYENPGTYTATLTVNPGGATRSVQVNVTSPDAQWSGANTVCVYNTAPAPVPGQGGCPSGATVAQVGGSLTTAITNSCTGAKRCLFRRGETYTSSVGVVIPEGNRYFGAYGTGPKPVWQDASPPCQPGTQCSLIRFNDNLSDFHFVDLDLHGKLDVINSPSYTAFGAIDSTVINRALWLRTDFSRFDVAIYMHCNDWQLRNGQYAGCNLDADDVHHEIAFVDSTTRYSPGAQANSSHLANIYITAKYFAMGGSVSGDDLAGTAVTNGIYGSSFDARMKWLDRAYIVHNDWGLLNPGPDPMGVASEVIGCGHEYEEGTDSISGRGGFITFRNGLNAVGIVGDYPSKDEIFSDNYVSSCKYLQGAMFGFGQTDTTLPKIREHHQYARMTGNLFTGETSGRQGPTVQMVNHGKVDGLLISNNVFDGTRYVRNSGSITAITIGSAESQVYLCSRTERGLQFSCTLNNQPNDTLCQTTTQYATTDSRYHGEIGPCLTTPNPNYIPPRDWRIYNNTFVVGSDNITSNPRRDFWGETLDGGNHTTLSTGFKFDNNLFYDADNVGSLPTSFPGMTFCGTNTINPTDSSRCNLKLNSSPFLGSIPFIRLSDFSLTSAGLTTVTGSSVALPKTEVPRDLFGNFRSSPYFAGAGGTNTGPIQQTPDTTAPATPTGLTATVVSSTQINLSWTASTDPIVSGQITSGLVGYRVFQDGVQVATPTSNSYQVTGLTAGTAYAFTVAAADNAGNASAQSTAANATTTGTPIGPQPDLGRGVGFNLGWVQSTQTQIIFTDIFKQSGYHGLNPWTISPSTATVNFNANGYPLAITAPVSVFTEMVNTDGRYPTGPYTLKFDGDGTVVISGDASGTFNTPTVNCTGTACTFNVTTPTRTGLRLAITRSNSANPVRNIHVVMPGFASTYDTIQVFNPAFINTLRGAKVIRFMDWLRTNGSINGTWSVRTTLTSASQTGSKGAAYEYAIQLSNQIGADPWFTISHLADDTYIRELARLTKQTLNADRKVYLEYSNELWNGGFDQINYVRSQGLTLGLDTDPARAGRKYTAKRSAEIFKIFEDEFGTTDRARLVKVIPAWQANTLVASEILDAFRQPSINGVPVNPTGVQANALAIAPYFGNGLEDELRPQASTATLDLVFSRLPTYLANTLTNINNHKTVAENYVYRLPLIAYEGGQHLAEDSDANGVILNQTISNLMIAANRDPRMYGIYQTYLNNWFGASTNPLAHFLYVDEPNDYGSWGALEYLGQPLTTAHKYRALQPYLATVAPVCGNSIVEGTEQCDGVNLNGQSCTTNGFTGGTLTCSATCTFNTSQCTITSTADTTAPTPPSRLEASGVTSSEINLSWIASTDPTVAGQITSGLAGYRVTQNGTQVATPTTNSYRATGLMNSTNYAYTVVAYDVAGNVSAISSISTTTLPLAVEVDTVAPRILTVTPLNLGQDRITINLTTDELSVTRIEYGFSSNYGQTTPPETNPGTNHTQTLISLLSDTDYHYRIIARDAASNESSTVDYTFHTLAPPQPVLDTTPPQTIVSAGVSQIENRSAVVSWTAPYEDRGDSTSGVVASYDLRYSTNPITDANWENAAEVTVATGEPTPATPGTAESYILVGLSPNRTYYAALRSVDSAGNISALSNVVTFTTHNPNQGNNNGSNQVTTTSSGGSSSGGGGGGGGLGGTPTTATTLDTVAPTSALTPTAYSADKQVILQWRNPANQDFARMLILRSTVPLPVITSAGNPRLLPMAQAVYEGAYPYFANTNLLNGQTYYYTFYAYDRSGNHSVPTTVIARPIAGVSPNFPVLQNQAPVNQAQVLELRKLLLSLLQKLLELLRAR